MLSGEEALIFGLRQHTQYNGRLCVVEGAASSPEGFRLSVRLLPYIAPPIPATCAELTALRPAAIKAWALKIGVASEQLNNLLTNCGVDSNRAQLLELMQEQKPNGGKLLSVLPRNLYPNTKPGRQQLLADRCANVLALRGAFESKLAGATDALTARIACWVQPPERLMVFSGYRSKVFNTVYMFSAVSGSWEQPTQMLTPRIDCACIKLDSSRLLFAGGVDDHPLRGTVQNSAAVYDAVSNHWISLPPMPNKRHGCSGVVVSNVAYVVGGGYSRVQTDACCDTLEITSGFDLAKWQQCQWKQITAPPCGDVVFAAVGAVGGNVIVAGGEGGNDTDTGSPVDGVSRSTCAYSPRTQAWTVLAPLPYPRSACGFCSWRNLLVLVGGRGGAHETLDTCEAFDGQKWLTMPDMCEARLGPALACANGVLYAIGGVSDRNGAGWGAHSSFSNQAPYFTAEIERFEPAEPFLHEDDSIAGRWVPCPELRAPQAYHACFAAGLAPLYD